MSESLQNSRSQGRAAWRGPQGSEAGAGVNIILIHLRGSLLHARRLQSKRQRDFHVEDLLQLAWLLVAITTKPFSLVCGTGASGLRLRSQWVSPVQARSRPPLSPIVEPNLSAARPYPAPGPRKPEGPRALGLAGEGAGTKPGPQGSRAG